MPNWKKVVVSGSDAVLNSVTASFTGSLTGTLIGTASWANESLYAYSGRNSSNGAGLGKNVIAFTDGGSSFTSSRHLTVQSGVNDIRVIVTGSINITGALSLKGIDNTSTSSLLVYNPTNGNVTYVLTSSITPSTASYALSASVATSASYAANGGVTQLLAGPNITLSPIDGKGQVTVSATLSGSTSFNTSTGSYGSFYDTTTQTNPVGNVPRSMSFDSTDITNGVSISGSTNPFNTYIKTTNAGVYNIQFSAQIDKTDAGNDEIVIWLRKNGIDLTDTATTLTLSGNNDKKVAAWNWFVNSAANDYYQIIWLSADTDLRLLAEPISGTHPGIPSVILTVNRVDQFLSNTGSFSGSFTGAFTGSLFGTGSWANNATTSSYALTASHTPNSVVEFTNQSTWTFTHNLNNRYVIVQTLDSNHNQNTVNL